MSSNLLPEQQIAQCHMLYFATLSVATSPLPTHPNFLQPCRIDSRSCSNFSVRSIGHKTAD
jgi:hypothetical protein